MKINYIVYMDERRCTRTGGSDAGGGYLTPLLPIRLDG